MRAKHKTEDVASEHSKYREDSVSLAHERADRLANAAIVAIPFALLCWAIWLAWGGLLHWQNLLVMAIMYLLTGAGITVGYHRLFTHRSLKTTPLLRGVFAVLGSAAVEGPVIDWVATHRKHHRFSDEPGDPHSPHLDHAQGFRGALRGLYHAHVGWTVEPGEGASSERYAKDLLSDPLIKSIDRTFGLWVVLVLAVTFGLGVALTDRVSGGLGIARQPPCARDPPPLPKDGLGDEMLAPRRRPAFERASSSSATTFMQ